jgi:hypothetical protein
MYWYNAYARWFEGTDTGFWRHMDSLDELKQRNLITVVTPDQAVKRIRAAVADAPLESFGISIAPPGLPVSKVRHNIELFAKEVMPHFK